MKRTQETLKEMSKILTENDEVQGIMTMLASKAEESNLSYEEWGNAKLPY